VRMLVHKQIKTLAKPYTDRAMIQQAVVLAIGPASQPMWSNKSIIFFEPRPKSCGDIEPSELQANNLDSIQEWCANPGVQVWPVEIGPLYDGFARDGGDSHSMILLRFVTATGSSHWFDARYVSAILKRDSDPDWYFNQGRLMAKDSTQVTITSDDGAQVIAPKGDPIAILMEWAWGKDAAAAIDNYRNWDPDWRLANECTKSWHTLRWAQRLDRALPRGKQGSQYTRLNGGSPARRGKGNGHKYIELASESGNGSIRISLWNGEITNLA